MRQPSSQLSCHEVVEQEPGPIVRECEKSGNLVSDRVEQLFPELGPQDQQGQAELHRQSPQHLVPVDVTLVLRHQVPEQQESHQTGTRDEAVPVARCYDEAVDDSCCNQYAPHDRFHVLLQESPAVDVQADPGDNMNEERLHDIFLQDQVVQPERVPDGRQDGQEFDPIPKALRLVDDSS